MTGSHCQQGSLKVFGCWGLLLLLLVMSPSLLAKGISVDAALTKLISTKDSTVSAEVVRLQDGEVLYENGAADLKSPASLTKLVVAAAALEHFGPDKSFVTEVYRSGSMANGILKGNLIVVGGGDPLLLSEKIWQLAADLAHLGLTEVAGDLVIDNSRFGEISRDDSRSSGAAASSNAYDAPISAFGINFNTLVTAVAPAEKIGQPARINFDPYPLADLRIVNKVTTGREGVSKKLVATRQSTSKGPDVLQVSGIISRDAELKKIWRSLGDPIQGAGEILKSFMKGAGIKVRGLVRAGTLPGSAESIYKLQGYPLGRILWSLNTWSNNYVADVMLKNLAVTETTKGTFKGGLGFLKQYLQTTVGIRTPFVVENASGLDSDNRLSSRQLNTILRRMESRLDVFPEFIASLAASGQTGTLKKRMASGNLIGLVRGKTGTLTQPVSVAALAGYVRHPKHGLLAFSVIHNGVVGRSQPSIVALRDLQDRFVEQLAVAAF